MEKSTQEKIMELVNIANAAYNEIKLLGGAMWVKGEDGTMHKAGEFRRAYGGLMTAQDLENYDFFFDAGGYLDWHN